MYYKLKTCTLSIICSTYAESGLLEELLCSVFYLKHSLVSSTVWCIAYFYLWYIILPYCIIALAWLPLVVLIISLAIVYSFPSFRSVWVISHWIHYTDGYQMLQQNRTMLKLHRPSSYFMWVQYKILIIITVMSDLHESMTHICILLFFEISKILTGGRNDTKIIAYEFENFWKIICIINKMKQRQYMRISRHR